MMMVYPINYFLVCFLDPDKALARMEAIQRARERQQQLLDQATARALEAQKEVKTHSEKHISLIFLFIMSKNI